jgi:hypothetical protein
VVYLPAKTSVAAVTPEKPAPEPRPFLRRDRRSSDELLKSLESASREIRLDETTGTSERLLREAKADEKATPVLDEIARRPDLAGLPVRQASACKADPTRARLMTGISKVVQNLARMPMSSTVASFSSRLAVQDWIGAHSEFMTEEGIPTLHQMLQVQEPDVRLPFVEALAKVKGPAAITTLSHSALYDLSPHVREVAIQSLKSRPLSEVRPLLLAGFRHPWAPAADHAAEALAALQDEKAAPALVDLLDQPDPCMPVPKGPGQWVVSELVRVNHLRNCLLCHAPSFETSDLVRGPVPTPGKRLPQAYYEEVHRGPFVRADVTYLRQDFSVMQPVAGARPWPPVQRFDYLVRQRPLTAAKAAQWAVTKPTDTETPRGSYPQREAVLFALRELTGMDAGKSSLGWRLALWMKGISTGF